MDPQHRIPVDFETKEVPSEWKCNPFKEPGRLQVDTENKVRRARDAEQTTKKEAN